MQIALTFRGAVEFTEEAIMEMYRASREGLVEQTAKNEDLALFIVNNERLARLSEGPQATIIILPI